MVKALEAEGTTGAGAFAEFAAKLERPRIAWSMVPAAVVTQTLDRLRRCWTKHADADQYPEEADAETAPLRSPRPYQYTIDVGEAAGV